MVRLFLLQLMDAEGRYVTPLLYPAYPGDLLPLDEIFSNTGSNCSKPGTFSANDLLTSRYKLTVWAFSPFYKSTGWLEDKSFLACRKFIKCLLFVFVRCQLFCSPMPESISQSSLSSDDFWTEMNSSLALQDINPNLPVPYS